MSALRLGYIVAPWEMLARLIALKADSGTGALDQMIVAEYFGKHFDEHVLHLSAVLKEKRDTMIEAVERAFGTHAVLPSPVLWFGERGGDRRRRETPRPRVL